MSKSTSYFFFLRSIFGIFAFMIGQLVDRKRESEKGDVDGIRKDPRAWTRTRDTRSTICQHAANEAIGADNY